jgi:prepilin-type N-terminal cleavage/methylation domain-containing protein
VLHRLRAVRQNVRQNQDGFTLVELLIVIVILGILAAIVVFAVNGITDRGVTSACKTDMVTAQTASDAYYAQNGGWAASIPALVAAGLLRTAPPDGTVAGDRYEILYNAATGAVTGNLLTSAAPPVVKSAC